MDFSFWFLLLTFFPFSYQKCVWYEECHKDRQGKIKNCVYNGEPKPFPSGSKALDILKQKCSFFLQQFPENKFCCDEKQVETMQRNMKYAEKIFGRCPTCITNLSKHICEMVCSPNQSNHMKIVKSVNCNITNKEYITEIDFHLSQDYMDFTYESCKEVTVPSIGGKAIEVSCGEWGADGLCNPQRWFEFFGDEKSNIQTPFQINYKASSEHNLTALRIPVKPCNESYQGQLPCSCSDCEASCTIPFNHPSPVEPFVVGSMDGVLFVMIILFSIICLVLFVLAIRFRYFGPRVLPNKVIKKNTKNNCLEKVGDKLKNFLRDMFTKWGTLCARNPFWVLCAFSLLIICLSPGISLLKITTNPTEIWASPVCESRKDKTYFDTTFGPFYRTNQVLIKTKGLKSFNWTAGNPDSSLTNHTFGPAFNINFLREVFKLQMSIQKLGENEGKGLSKICYAPMKNEFFPSDSVEFCAIQSVWGYLKNNEDILDEPDTLYDTLRKCLRNNFNPDCLAPYGGPIFSPLAVGGHREGNNYLMATGVSLTFLVNNAMKETDLEAALAWEKTFVDFMRHWDKNNRPEFIEVAYSAERSIQDEIERESKAEMMTVVVSYLVMFAYITVALGRIRRFSSLWLDSKFSLGIGGIVIVLASVVASAGVFGYLGVPTTLLTIEVIPFLVLAVGVDNIFILVHTYQELEGTSKRSIEEDIGLTLGKVGPSILLTSTSEAFCFLIGTLSNMPAIKTFAEYSSLAIVFNFLLQISCFIGLLAIDSRRQKNNRADIIWCLKVKKVETQEKTSGALQLMFKEYFGPFLMRSWVRFSVIVLFIFWFCSSLAFIPRIEKGLDQELSMPEDSHIIDYFQFMRDLMSVGPPVYFVIKNGFDYNNPAEVNAICGSVACDSDSLVTYLTRASRLSNISYIAKSPSSWIDDYFDWLSDSESCCRYFESNNSFCPHQRNDCKVCSVDIVDWRPRPEHFTKYLPFFLNDNPDDICVKGGHASYAGGVKLRNESGEMAVKDNYFMTYHVSLKTSRDFYMALKNARHIARHLTEVLTSKLGRTVEVFPYSIFYVYYEQYLTIVEDALISLSSSLLAVFGVTFLLSGFDFRSAFLVTLVVASMLVNMTALLYWWNISLNAVSLVNLIVAVGIGVEFCSHIVHAFVTSPEVDRTSRALFAISSMGSSVFSGITLTKFLGIFVLAFAQTLMLRTFYFRMYLGIVIMGVAHGLIITPVLLSFVG